MQHPEKKVAILLNALGANGESAEVVETSLSEMSGDRAKTIRAILEEFQDEPPSAEEEDAILDEFETFFRFAIETANLPSSWVTEQLDSETQSESDTDEDQAAEDEAAEISVPEKPGLKIFTPTDDPVFDLRRLSPLQIAGALSNEKPRTIALVLNELEKANASRVIENLPDNLQSDVFLEFKNQPTAPPELLNCILRATVDTGALVEDVKQEEPDVNQEIADLLRGMPKTKRSRIMEDIKQRDAETAEMISNLLYVFEDILTYEDRSIQKLLSELNTATLVIALQNADPAIIEAILSNLSKRARQSLEEELELAPKTSDADIEVARKSIAEIIAKLDQSGQLEQK